MSLSLGGADPGGRDPEAAAGAEPARVQPHDGGERPQPPAEVVRAAGGEGRQGGGRAGGGRQVGLRQAVLDAEEGPGFQEL
ncbi:unnamed protein product [Sphagnum tenellum]